MTGGEEREEEILEAMRKWYLYSVLGASRPTHIYYE